MFYITVGLSESQWRESEKPTVLPNLHSNDYESIILGMCVF